MKKLLSCLIVLVFSLISVPAVQAQCPECGVSSANIDVWRSLDFNGNGLTTYDLMVVARMLAISGQSSLTRSEIAGLALAGVDVNDDGVYDNTDLGIVKRTNFWLNRVGEPALDQHVIDCLRKVILGICG